MAENTAVDLVQPHSDEKLLKQSEVNDIVREAKRHAAEKARADALREMQATVVPQAQSLGGMPQMSPEEIKRLIAEESARSMQHQAASMQLQKLATDFAGKIAGSKEKYPGLESELNGM